MAVSILEIAPKNLSLRSKQYLEVFDTMYQNYADDALEMVKNIFNTEYPLPTEVVGILLDLFGFTLPDLQFLDDTEREKIENLFIDNIFVFYKNRASKEIFNQMLYVFGLTGNIYLLETYDWDNFIRTDASYLDTNRFTDIGLFTDMNYTTDNVFRTPFLDIEIILNKVHTVDTVDYLWYLDINNAIKREMDNIRYVLSKLFYHFVVPVDALENDTRTGTNGVEAITSDITDKFDIRRYRLTFDDATTELGYVENIDEDTTNYYYEINTKFNESKKITTAELLDISDTTVYCTINCPEIYLEVEDFIYFNVVIEKN